MPKPPKTPRQPGQPKLLINGGQEAAAQETKQRLIWTPPPPFATPPSRSLDNFHEPLPLSIIIDLIDASTAAAAALFQSWLVRLRFFDASFFSLWCFSGSLSLSPWLCLSLTVSLSLSLYIIFYLSLNSVAGYAAAAWVCDVTVDLVTSETREKN